MRQTLSPAERAEVTRFGIHDDDVLRDMESRLDEEIGCSRAQCDAAASWSISARCCGVSLQLCTAHLQLARIMTDIGFCGTGLVECVACGVRTRMPVAFDELYRVVPL
ncbi:hypothetical protein [Microbacterium sp. SORGH_AS_0505]|uniref:hypothetical protein n=1 Tax=Microbacterium sp. SORGH_AS_0505 TaxID=3041770 RepID=UPI0027D8F100|nr:hypothetical protein [Microbacterium sp. SORGH_AS_0505]